MKLTHKFSLVLLAAASFFMSGCDKTEPYEIAVAQPEIHFNGSMNRSASVEDPADPISLEIGTTDVSSADRLVTYTISSPSGAQPGVEYEGSATGTVTIPAGETLANIVIQPIPSGFPLDSRDTLIIALTQPSMKPSTFGDTLRLILRGPSSSTCSEDAPDFSQWLTNNAFATVSEVWNGGTPYIYSTPVVIESVVQSGTSATLGISNIWDTGWGPLSVSFDWSDASNPTTSIVTGDIPGSDAGDINSAYAGTLVMARPHPTTSTGSYSFCNETIVLNMQLGVSGLGWFTSGGNNILYTVTISR